MAYTNYSWITERLAVGGAVTGPEDDFPFDAVLSLETHAPPAVREVALSPTVEYQWQSIVDGTNWETHDDIVRRFDDAAALIDRWQGEGKRVLVHCAAGVSRSVSAVVWYLVRYRGYRWDDALAVVRAVRPQAHPNVRFETVLRMAAGESVTREHVAAMINRWHDRRLEELGEQIDREEVWSDLAHQGTLQRIDAANPAGAHPPAGR